MWRSRSPRCHARLLPRATDVNSSEFLLPLEQQCNIIRTLRAGGAEKINFAGGEPFLYARELGELVKYGGALDILGLSIDTQYSSVNFSHGRWPIKGILSDSARQRNRQLEQARRVRAWCAERGIKFKVNTVVTALNADEDMSPLINELRPMRWKVFQVLPLEGENCGAGKGAGQDVLPLLITHEQFQRYIERNAGGLDASLSHDGVLEAEDNDTMKTSYVLVDERGCFLDSSGGGKKPTRSILDVGLSEAFRELQDDTRGGFDRTLFVKRNGYYPERWSRSPPATGAELV